MPKKKPSTFVPKLKDRPVGMSLELARILQGICKNARTAKELKLVCEVCMSPSTGKCSSDKHWVCDDCMMFHRCGCE